jgi:hypothetical protein
MFSIFCHLVFLTIFYHFANYWKDASKISILFLGQLLLVSIILIVIFWIKIVETHENGKDIVADSNIYTPVVTIHSDIPPKIKI